MSAAHRQSAAQTSSTGRPLALLRVSNWLLAQGGGGIQTHLANSARALSEKPLQVSYAAVMPGSIPDFVWVSDDVAVHMGTPGSPRILNVLRLREWLARHLPAFDIVHFHGPLGYHFLVGAPMAQRYRIPYVVNAHGSLAPPMLAQLGRGARMAYRLRGRALLRGAAAVLATSDLEARIIRSTDALLDVRVVAPGIAVPERPTANYHQAGESRPLRIVFLGRVEPIKAVPVLLAAVAQLKQGGGDVQLDVLGSGARGYMEELRERASRLGVEENVVWHGYQGGDAKTAVMRRSNVLALPSYSENHGFSAVEAMALGLPVVVSDGVGVAETLRRYGAGTVVPVGDAEALASALAGYRDPRYRRRVGIQAHSCALREFSLSSMGEGLAAVYWEAADR